MIIGRNGAGLTLRGNNRSSRSVARKVTADGVFSFPLFFSFREIRERRRPRRDCSENGRTIAGRASAMPDLSDPKKTFVEETSVRSRNGSHCRSPRPISALFPNTSHKWLHVERESRRAHF